MCKKTTFFAILIAFLGIFQANAAPLSGSPVSSAQFEPPCILPAPAFVNWSFLTPTTVQVTWSSVPGAWGYQATLTGPSGPQGGTTNSTSMTFTVNQNEVNTFTVACMCGQNSISSYNTVVLISSYIVITDVLLDYDQQPCQNLTLINDANPTSKDILDYQSSANAEYYLRFMKGGTPYDVHYIRTSLGGWMPNYKFELRKVCNQGSSIECFDHFQPNNGAEVCVGAKFDAAGATAYIKMGWLLQASALDQLYVDKGGFDSYSLNTCGSKVSCYGGGRSDVSPAQGNSYVVSPFSDQLVIGLNPDKHLKSFRLTGINGNLVVEQQYPQELEFGERLIMATDHLAPGLYILQLQSTDGSVETFKVVKQQ